MGKLVNIQDRYMEYLVLDKITAKYSESYNPFPKLLLPIKERMKELERDIIGFYVNDTASKED